MPPEPQPVTISPQVANDGTPFVKIELVESVQVTTPTGARQMAGALIEMAAVAEYESAIIRMKSRLGDSAEVINRAIGNLREEVNRQRNQQN